MRCVEHSCRDSWLDRAVLSRMMGRRMERGRLEHCTKVHKTCRKACCGMAWSTVNPLSVTMGHESVRKMMHAKKNQFSFCFHSAQPFPLPWAFEP